MSKGDNLLKILYILDILKDNRKKYSPDDKERFLSANRLVEMLNEKYGLSSDRKSIYSYIKTLSEYGCEFSKNKKGCYLEKCPDDEYAFETTELKMIADAVIVSPFYTEKQTRKIISKLEKLLIDNSMSLKKDSVLLEHMKKGTNNAVVYNIYNIYKAIDENKQISFYYYNTEISSDTGHKHFENKFNTNENKTTKIYFQSPYHLIWKNDTYYLLAFDSIKQDMRTFRVDRMYSVIVQNGKDNTQNLKRDGKKEMSKKDFSDYATTAFDMFGGETKNISLRVNKKLAKVIADRFGMDTNIYSDNLGDDDFFLCSVNVQVSNMFFGWLSSFQNDIQITYPNDVKRDYMNYLKNLLESYNNM